MAEMRQGSDMYNGTQLQQTATGPGSSVRLRRMFVAKKDEQLDGAELIAKAKNEFLSESSNLYAPGLPYLPLTRVAGRQIARNLVELTIDYEVVQDFVGPGTELATFQSTIMPVKIWTSALEGTPEPSTDDPDPTPESVYVRGMPFGRTLKGLAPSSQHTEEQHSGCPSKTHERTAVRIRVKRTLFGINPMEEWGDLIRTTGSGSIAGFTCAKGTLLFEGLSSTQTTSGTSDPGGITPPEMTIYTFNLDFVYDPNGFPTQSWVSQVTRRGDDGVDYEEGDTVPDGVEVTVSATYSLQIENEYKTENWVYEP